VWYQLQRPIGGKVYQLHLKTHLRHSLMLKVDLTCPDLKELGPWQASPSTTEPAFDPRTGRLNWTTTLPADFSEWSWTWG
jgi:hypothetical protein